MIDKFSLTLFKLQIDLNFGLLQKRLDKQESSSAFKSDYSRGMKRVFLQRRMQVFFALMNAFDILLGGKTCVF